MGNYQIRPFTANEIPQITALQQAYQQVYPHASVVPGEVYLSPGFEQGKNIFCAFDEKGQVQGYAPVFPNLSEEKRYPHILWTEVKAHPLFKGSKAVKEALFDQVIKRTREIQQAHPKNKCRLTFQYHPTEMASIQFVQSHGCAHSESVFRLLRDLSGELMDAPLPPNKIEVRPWKIESEVDLQAYVLARNEAFPEATITPADWQAFLHSDSMNEGTTITAFDGQEICGCVTAYWDEAISQRLGQKVGFTEYIFVREKWRKQGIAAFMITQAMSYLKEHGREAAFLEVKAANEKALSVYYRLGYVKVDETRLYVLDM